MGLKSNKSIGYGFKEQDAIRLSMKLVSQMLSKYI